MANIANSWWMYLLGIIVSVFVTIGSLVFIIQSFKDAKKIGMDKQETAKIDNFDYIRKHWKAVPYDEDLPLAARSTGDISEETLEKLKEIAEEE